MTGKTRIMVLDNYDSFTYNLVYALQAPDRDICIYRNQVPLTDLLAAASECQALVISPGPGAPGGAGNAIALTRAMLGKIPILGVCLGLQVIVEALGGKVAMAADTLHGKACRVELSDSRLFAGVPGTTRVARYHSLAAVRVPDSLRISALADQEVMAIENSEDRVFGLQFHPESLLTLHGQIMLDNFMALVSAAPADGGDSCRG